MTNYFNMNGKDVIFTGGCGNLGRVMVKALLEYGARVAVPSRTDRFDESFNEYKENGKYHLELIQAGKDNTFTDLQNGRIDLRPEDLFGQGDSFTVESYAEFFIDGKMDDGTAFGYRIDIVSVTDGENPSATIRITKQ